ncbi:MAG TPA: NrfD/PsrC family molybdoenzyme membrane anchor subunit [Arenicellales bacterium]|jgi:molybdopterin-containing oxidoreductase family membrane subunit|nr:NrfD/PsrC family molybdoenzyme membrane anchor subunit [Arenicellales bacterium]
MDKIRYQVLAGTHTGYRLLLWLLIILIGIGLIAAHHMETQGHWVTGMDNRVVWGLPHVFAIFLILSASGALNTASISSVFGRSDYQPLARLSGLLAVTLLTGGLAVLVLDLGRPDRLVVAMTYYNFSSVFAWNVFLYTGFMLVVLIYLWVMMTPQMRGYVRSVGVVALIWRLILTSGTGAIFGFLVARDAYDTAIMVPLFILMSLSLGMAVFWVSTLTMCRWNGYRVAPELSEKLRRLSAVFVLGVLFLMALHHLTNIYMAHHQGIERFLLVDGGVYPWLFWLGFVLCGSIVPVWWFLDRRFCTPAWTVTTALMVIVGGLCHLYVTIIGAQAYPLRLVSGYRVDSGFYDGEITHYLPTLPELALGIGGVSLALLITMLAVRILPFLPTVTRPLPGSNQG